LEPGEGQLPNGPSTAARLQVLISPPFSSFFLTYYQAASSSHQARETPLWMQEMAKFFPLLA